MKPAPPRLASRAGVTLVEMLIAIALLVLITGTFLFVYRTLASGLDRQESSRRTWHAAAAAMDTLRRDLACALTPAVAPDPPLLLETTGEEPEQESSATFYTAFVPAQGAENGGIRVHKVRYHLRPSDGGQILVREWVALAEADGNPPSGTEDLAEGITGLQIRLLGPNGWRDQWPEAANAGLPRAARVRLTVRDNGGVRLIETTVLIPAGNTVRPSAPAAGAPST